MNVVMVTNTFTPHVGGVARSVATFTDEYRRRGHRVLVVAPEFEHTPPDEIDVVRVPAIQNFNGSDFSVALPMPGFLAAAIKRFGPDLVHAHHPFLLGATALRFSHMHRVPLVFTHHTLYEQYTHYVPGDSQTLKRFVIRLSTSYANQCNLVFAPSRSIAELIAQRGVQVPIEVVPTGIDCARFAAGDGAALRAELGLAPDAVVIGHLGRLAPEKNLAFLTAAVIAYLRQAPPRSHFLMVGRGPAERTVRERFAAAGLGNRLHLTGTLEQPRLADAYRAMDVFVFASQSETQGLVLAEAMAAGLPVVALDAPGVREVVNDGVNGRLLARADPAAFAAAIAAIVTAPPARRQALQRAAQSTAQEFSTGRSADKALACYESLLRQASASTVREYRLWRSTQRLIKTEWELLKGIAGASPSGAEEAPNEPPHDMGSRGGEGR